MAATTRYPPCLMNPITELPYPRHKWEIAAGANVIAKTSRTGETIYYYRVRCSRCKFNDPAPPLH